MREIHLSKKSINDIYKVMFILNKGGNRPRQTFEKEEEVAATAVPGYPDATS